MKEEVRSLPNRSIIMHDPIENGKNRNNKGQFVVGNTASVGKGRPKGSQSIPDLLRKIGEEEVPTELNEKVKKLFGKANVQEISMIEAIMRTTMMYAIQGKSWAVQFIAERLEGKAKEHIITEEIKPIRVLEFGDDLIDER